MEKKYYDISDKHDSVAIALYSMRAVLHAPSSTSRHVYIFITQQGIALWIHHRLKMNRTVILYVMKILIPGGLLIIKKIIIINTE